jgi:hypothetical protein
MKLKNTWMFFDALIPHSFKNRLQNMSTHMRLAPFSTAHQRPASTDGAEKTHLRNEAQHGLWYGAGIGLLMGVYILFFPLWITVSPAWYTHAPWYAILAITTLSCMLIAGCGAAVLGAHVSNRKLRAANKTASKASPKKAGSAR